MPGRGTKRIVQGERTLYQPASEVELGELIREGIAAQAAYDEAKERLQRIKAQIVEAAKARLNPGTASVTLIGALGGEARIVFARETVIDTPLVQQLERELKPELFQEVFARGVIYRLAKGYHHLMERGFSAEIDKFRARIAAAVFFKDKAPSVKFLAEP